MARTRSPLSAQLPFEYVVLGQPYSAGNKTAGYAAWREKAAAEVTEEIEVRTNGRSFIPSSAAVRILVVWLSAQPNSDAQPDLSNILKPLEDALVGRLIEDDRQIRRIEAVRIDLNRAGLKLPDAVKTKQDDPAYAVGELTYVRVDILEAVDGAQWEWWK